MKRIVGLLVLLSACGGRPQEYIVAFTGGTVFDGTGADPIADAVLLVVDGRVSALGTAAEIALPDGVERIPLDGRYIVPGLVNTHGHVGDTRGLESGHYNEENILAQLRRYATYGVTTVVSLGGDGPEGVAVRDAQTDMTTPMARLYLAGPVVAGSDPDSVRAQVRRNAALGVDFIKIRVDDNLGTTRKMPPSAYRAAIDAAHAHGLRVAGHIFYASDARDLLDAGIDFLAHSVRDGPIDQELTTRLRSRNVCYTPTLTREVSTFVYEREPDFFADSFFLRSVDAAVLAALRDPEYQRSLRESVVAQRYKAALPVAMDNLKRLHDAGVPIALGTDTGPPRRFQGYFEHLEMQMMAEAGLPPREILLAATGRAADCMGLDDVGTLEHNRWADFVVLDSDPLAEIRNLRTIRSVWIGGVTLTP